MTQRRRNTKDFSATAETLKSAAHPERLAIMNLLWDGGCKPMNVKTIYTSLGLEQSTVSLHLGILKRCGLLKKTGSGITTSYSLDASNHITRSMVKCLHRSND